MLMGADGGLADATAEAHIASGAAAVRAAADAIRANVSQVMVGKASAIDLLLVTLLSEGHALIEDVPGLGKTVMAKALARSLGVPFARIQGTADLLPSDVTGVSYFSQKASEFEFRPGPIFASIVLADEINRATPRTQSALLEAMQERQATVDGRTMPLPLPFLLVATQNPIELEGTFPLPEAQLDRFLTRLRVAYPTFDDERAMLYRFKEAQPLETLQPVVSGDELLQLLPVVRAVRVAEPVSDYLLKIVRETREHPAIELGASPRAALALFRAAQAHAAMRGRTFVKPDDLKALAAPVLAHRLVVSAQTRLRGQGAEQVIQSILDRTPVPVEKLGDDDR
ncbi:MAG: MoxR-like ATPase [Ktedonobacterales bacterium]|jgi:MoxR-like ATPase|nr:MAG: MoxR-like ATPase [Ktedonobacterales bacterium]